MYCHCSRQICNSGKYLNKNDVLKAKMLPSYNISSQIVNISVDPS